MIYSFYVYRRDGVCLFKTTYHSVDGDVEGDPEAEDEREKLVFGMAFSLKELIGQLSPMDGSTGQQIDCPLGTVKTKSSTMHTYETLTGFRFIVYTGKGGC
jgi:trafficking protein particle complex subunit 1